jgi:hypothetical protein
MYHDEYALQIVILVCYDRADDHTAFHSRTSNRENEVCYDLAVMVYSIYQLTISI